MEFVSSSAIDFLCQEHSVTWLLSSHSRKTGVHLCQVRVHSGSQEEKLYKCIRAQVKDGSSGGRSDQANPWSEWCRQSLSTLVGQHGGWAYVRFGHHGWAFSRWLCAPNIRLLLPSGMVTLPMTFLSGTPLDCTVHPSLWILDTGRNQSAAITMELKNFMGEGVEDTDLARQLVVSQQWLERWNKTHPHCVFFQPRYARFLRSYSKKYCTEMHVSPFLLYFPFSMFLVPLVVVFVERLFIR